MSDSPETTHKPGAFYATTPIFYVNAEPHIGHAYTTIMVDVVSRFHRLAGDDTRFLTGTDEHGEKIAQAAEQAGMSPEAYTDKIAAKFQHTWDALGLSYDEFIRTTEPRHKAVVQELLQQVYDSGDIYYGEYTGLYCVGAERFVTEKELVDGKCPESDDEPIERTEANYFFRMEKYQDWWRETLESNPHLIQPDRYRNEVLGMLREPIGDLSISRPASRVPWGIPLPWDEDHVTYVWFDALINYYSALKSQHLVDRYWPAVHHFIAKDIVKPHGLFWPIMLKAAGLPLYQQLSVHGYWLTDGRKMSKSLGNVVRPLDLQEKYGQDALRYFLIRDMSFGLDATFSEVALAERVNADLANDLGNLLNRTLGMITRYRGGVVPPAHEMNAEDTELRNAFLALPDTLTEAFANLHFDRGVTAVLTATRLANKYIADVKPWELAKDEAQAKRLDTVLNTLVEALRCVSILLDPVIPGKAAELREQLGVSHTPVTLDAARSWGAVVGGEQTKPGNPLFPRIDVDELLATIAAEQESGTEVEEAIQQPAGKELIEYDEFDKVELRVAHVTACEAHPKADRLLVLTVDLGYEQRTIVSGIREHYDPADLVGKNVVIVANLTPVTLRGIESQGMVLSAEDASGLAVITTDRKPAPGSEVK